jgi:hypothetical protein
MDLKYKTLALSLLLAINLFFSISIVSSEVSKWDYTPQGTINNTYVNNTYINQTADLSGYWTSNGSSTATGNWNLSSRNLYTTTGKIGLNVVPVSGSARLEIQGLATGNAFKVIGGAVGYTNQSIYVNEYGTLTSVGNNNSANNLLFGALALGDTYGRFGFGFDTNDAFVAWGSGATARDLFLKRIAGDLVFLTTTSKTEKMRLKASGNLGLNTSTPNALIETYGTGELQRWNRDGTYYTKAEHTAGSLKLTTKGATSSQYQFYGNDDTPIMLLTPQLTSIYGEGLQFQRLSANGAYIVQQASNGGTFASPTDSTSSQMMGSFVFRGVKTGTWYNSARIRANVDGATGANDMPGKISFDTSPDGTATLTERMTIKNDGKIGVNTSSPAYPLDINASVSGISLYTSGNISATGYITRTDVYDSVKEGNALTKIKDSTAYYDSKGDVNHSAFEYSKVVYDKQVKNGTINVVTLVEDCKISTDKNGVTLIGLDEKPIETCSTKEQVNVVDTFTTIKEEGVSLDKEVALLKQAVYELKEQNEFLQQQINNLTGEDIKISDINKQQDEAICQIKIFSWCIK